MFSGLATILTDLALGSALVQRPSITEADRSTVFWTSALVGSLLTVASIALSVPIAWFYQEPDVQPLLAVYSVTFLLNGLSTTQATLLSRDLQFRRLELRIIVATLVSAPIGIAAAVHGAGAWAIIVQSLSYSVVSLALLWVASPWRPRLMYSLDSLRELGGFGLRSLGTRLAWFANTTTDTILIGRFLGPAAVGAYSIAFNLTTFPLSRVVTPLRDITFPAFSRIQNDRDALGAAWLRSTSLVAVVVAPAMLGMMVVAPLFVGVVLGERWSDAVPVIQALSWVALLFSLQQVGGGSALMALNRPGTLLRFTVATTVANIVAFIVGLSWGIVWLAVAYAVATTVITPIFIVVVARAVGVSLSRFAREVVPPFLAAAIMAGCVRVVSWLMPETVLPNGARLLLLIAVGVVVFLTRARGSSPTSSASSASSSRPVVGRQLSGPS